MHRFHYSESDGKQIVNYARDTIEVYAKEGQKMDVGSVNDLLNMKAGVFIQLESTGAFGRVRGSGAVYNSQSLASSIINSTVYAASNRSVGSEVSRNEISDLRFKIAVIESVKVTDEPLEVIEIGRDVPIMLSEQDHGWLFPTDAEEYGWSPDVYLTKTCKKVDLRPDYWEDNKIIVANTRTILEESPGGSVSLNSNREG